MTEFLSSVFLMGVNFPLESSDLYGYTNNFIIVLNYNKALHNTNSTISCL
jgi:hypothetical protein